MVEKNLKKLKAKKRRVMNGFNTGTRDMKLKTAYRRKKRWSADESADYSSFSACFSTPVNTLFLCQQTDSLNMECRRELVYRAYLYGIISSAHKVFHITCKACRFAAYIDDV